MERTKDGGTNALPMSDTGTDRGVGAALALGAVAVVGVVTMALNPGNAVAGWGFAVAMAAGAGAVVAAQLSG